MGHYFKAQEIQLTFLTDSKREGVTKNEKTKEYVPYESKDKITARELNYIGK